MTSQRFDLPLDDEEKALMSALDKTDPPSVDNLGAEKN
jgi:hypothetical protein